MILESLANELLLDLFEFLSTAQLLYSFYGLNHRFNMVLVDHFCVRGLDLRLVSKHNLDILCRQYLPSIANRITTLCLSNGGNSPQAVPFVARDFTLRQFTHLRALHLHAFVCVTTVNKMALDWDHLSHLTHLKLDNCYFPCNQADVVNLVNIIWSLPKLIYCYLDIDSADEIEFFVPSVISSSLEYLIIPNISCRMSELDDLIERTPRLRYLSTCFTYESGNRNCQSTISPITQFNTWFVSAEQNIIVSILQHMSNLRNLTVQTVGDIYIDGCQWEQIIHDHLIQLKRFRLRLRRKLVNNRNWKQNVDELVDSFRGQFWIKERCWFVQCDWDPDLVAIYLYTLPYAFDHLKVHFPLISKSTCPHIECNCSYDRVRQLKYTSYISEDFDQCHISFSDIQDLTVNLPINDHFWMVVPNFHRLTSLSVSWYEYDKSFPSQLQSMLDRATRLYSLSIATWRSFPSQMAPYDIINVSVRRLDFYDYHYDYNNEECATLSSSSLGIQCEILRISVENRTCILDLVNKMANLRELIVQCRDDTWMTQLTVIPDELTEWLQHQLPSTCTIRRYTRSASEVHLWIG